MNETDAMVSQEILDMLDIPIGGKILLKYDLLGFLPSDYQNLPDIIFGSNTQKNKDNSTKGEKFLTYLKLDPKMKLRKVETAIQQADPRTLDPRFSQLFLSTISTFNYTLDTPVAVVLTDLFGILKRSDFQLVRNFTVLTSIENNYAKWPKAFGNAIFLDSTYLFESLVEMIYANTAQLIARQDSELEEYLDIGKFALVTKELINQRAI